MISPGKFVQFTDSTLSDIGAVMVALDEPRQIHKLLTQTKRRFNGVSEFLYALDVLFVLGAIEVDFLTSEVKRAR